MKLVGVARLIGFDNSWYAIRGMNAITIVFCLMFRSI